MRHIYKIDLICLWLRVSRRQFLDWISQQLFFSGEIEFVRADGRVFQLDDEFLDRAFHGRLRRADVGKDKIGNPSNRWLSDLRRRARKGPEGIKQGPHESLLDRYRLIHLAIAAWNEELGEWLLRDE